ncbi:hypothetical protein [uncultured Caulobacter sp.]|uniref:hypothetical protein n=1 Tax=uncultured Caulobacter sp. TaxID=158749 RepID=UPI00262B94C6|nr:hypothetical protein [uncultured Caulobacter sp.]
MTIGTLARAGLSAAAILATLATAGVGVAGPGDDCPPNPEPGKCYEKVYTPARYEAYVEEEPARADQGPGPARVVVKRRQIREASFGWREVSCENGGVPPRRR